MKLTYLQLLIPLGALIIIGVLITAFAPDGLELAGSIVSLIGGVLYGMAAPGRLRKKIEAIAEVPS